MSQSQWKFKDFVDLLLYKLYEHDQQHSGEFVDLNLLSQQVRGDAPSEWVVDAAKVLDTRTLADVQITFSGVHAAISGEGRLYVEERRGITEDIEKSPAKY